MTRVTYILNNGTKTTSFAEAEANKPYTVRYEKIEAEPIKISEKRQAIRVKAVAKG